VQTSFMAAQLFLTRAITLRQTERISPSERHSGRAIGRSPYRGRLSSRSRNIRSFRKGVAGRNRPAEEGAKDAKRLKCGRKLPPAAHGRLWALSPTNAELSTHANGEIMT
jgi:hypothetical protein